jgi:acetyl-CoA C-acetyltransferase
VRAPGVISRLTLSSPPSTAEQNGWFNSEIVPVTVPGAKDGQGTVVDKDEEPGNLRKDKVATLRPAFQKNGTVTAANSSKLNDGASALVLMSVKRARELGLRPLARVRGFADAEREPIEFPIAPADAMQRAYKHAGIKQSDVDFYEINEAFAVVALANAKVRSSHACTWCVCARVCLRAYGQILGLDLAKLNVHGGAVSLGHPIGSSGARIIVTLANVLKQHNGSIGVASICNGGGGASAVVIERLN